MFEFSPKIWSIYEYVNKTTLVTPPAEFFLTGLKNIFYFKNNSIVLISMESVNSYNQIISNNNFVICNNNKIQWYSPNDEYSQLNSTIVEYYYFAIG